MNNLGIKMTDTRYSKKYKTPMIIFMITTLLFGGILGVGIYLNYDYLAFKILIAGNYIYTDALNELYQQQINESDVTNYYKNFDNVVIGVFTEKIREINNDRYTYLYTPPQYTISKETTKALAKEAKITKVDSDWVYLYLPNISLFTRDFVNENKEELNSFNNIIIDLRSNHGGDLEALYDISELFLDKDMIIGSEVARSSFFSKTIKSKNKAYFDFENIVFLQDSGTASAAEGFIMALKENYDNVTIVGTTSFGKGIGQITYPLKSGYAVKATVIKIETPLGNSIHQKGISPDIEYSDDDDIIDFILEKFSN